MRLLMLMRRAVRARMMLPIVPKLPRSVSMPGSSIAARSFSSTPAVLLRAAWRSMVERRSRPGILS